MKAGTPTSRVSFHATKTARHTKPTAGVPIWENNTANESTIFTTSALTTAVVERYLGCDGIFE